MLRSGWLTTGPRVRRFEADFAAAVGAPLAVAVNSGTAALHLAVEALGLKPGQAVLVPTMTFAATAEVVRYQGAAPLLVDCDPTTGLLDLDDAERKLADLKAGRTPLPPDLDVVGVIPVHVGGLMLDVAAVQRIRPPAQALGDRGRRAQFPRRLARDLRPRGGGAARTPPPRPASPSTRTRRSPPAKAAWRRLPIRPWPTA